MFSCFRRQTPRSARDECFERLSTEKIGQMQLQWKKISDKNVIGREILAALINTKPVYATFYGIRLNQMEEMTKNDKFRIQAQRIENHLDTTITSLGIVPMETIRKMNQNVGKIHFYHGVNFCSDLWVFFEHVLKAQLARSTELKSRSLNESWGILIDMIVSEMRNGFFREATEQNSDKPRKPEQRIRAISSSEAMRVPSDPKPDSPKRKLSERDVFLCRLSWQEASEKDIGMKILLSLIASKPVFATHFGVQLGLTPAELEVHPRVKLQAARIQGLLETVVTLYGAVPDLKIRDICMRVGRTHFHRGVNFTADNWLVFKRVTIEQVMEVTGQQRSFRQRLSSVTERTLDTQKAWHVLMGFVIHSMKDGFIQVASGNA